VDLKNINNIPRPNALSIGTDVADQAARPDVSAGGRLESHTPCHRCGYDLYKTSVHGQCPECGTIAAASIAGFLPLFSDEIWIAKVLSGVRRLVVSLAAAVLLVFLSMLLLASMSYSREAVTVYCFLLAGFTLWFFRAGWLLSTPDPKPEREGDCGRTRKLVRWALVAVASQGLADCAMLLGKNSLTEIGVAGYVESCVAQGIGIVWVYAHLQYLECLLRRMPDQGLSGAAKFLKWALSGIWTFQYVLEIIAMIGWYRPTGDVVIQSFVCSGMLAVAVGGFGYLIFLGFLHDALADLLRKARAMKCA
jgi:FtsH-binding integral membrane protein